MAQQLRAHPPENWDQYPCLRSFVGQNLLLIYKANLPLEKLAAHRAEKGRKIYLLYCLKEQGM